MYLLRVLMARTTIQNGLSHLSQNYHLIVEGTNELTSKIVCLDDSLGNITTKFYSINVTGINTNISSNSSSVPLVQIKLIMNLMVSKL